MTKAQHIVSSNVDTTLSILKRAAETEDVVLPDDVAMYIAGKIPSTDVRVLEGTLLRLMAYASLTGREISLELADECLRNMGAPVLGASHEIRGR
jgi:chromosomal replication initiator protein